MAHFAKLNKNNIVVFVTKGREEDDGKEDELSNRTGDVYKQTSYNTRGGVHYTDGVPSKDQSKALRFNYAGIGFTYDYDLDAFIPPKTEESFILDTTTCKWVPPIPYPDDGLMYSWNEKLENWEPVIFEEENNGEPK